MEFVVDKLLSIMHEFQAEIDNWTSGYRNYKARIYNYIISLFYETLSNYDKVLDLIHLIDHSRSRFVMRLDHGGKFIQLLPCAIEVVLYISYKKFDIIKITDMCKVFQSNYDILGATDVKILRSYVMNGLNGFETIIRPKHTWIIKSTSEFDDVIINCHEM
jgi:hypothetical protein